MWFLRRHKTPPTPKPTSTGGTNARERAERHLAEQRAQQPEVSRVAESLRELRERNHFAAQIRMIFLGGTIERH